MNGPERWCRPPVLTPGERRVRRWTNDDDWSLARGAQKQRRRVGPQTNPATFMYAR